MDQFVIHPTAQSVCGVGSVPYRPAYLTFMLVTIYINDAEKNYDVPTPNVYMTRINICSLMAPPVNPPT